VPLRAVSVSMVHCDAAAIDEGDTTLDVLMAAPSSPLINVGTFEQTAASA
jgi:hypothetical protein